MQIFHIQIIFFVSAYSSVSNTRTACNKQQGRPIFGLPVFLFDTLLNKNPKTVSNKAVQHLGFL